MIRSKLGKPVKRADGTELWGSHYVPAFDLVRSDPRYVEIAKGLELPE